MLALALTLTLAGPSAAAGPELHLVPPLALEQPDARGAPGADLAPPPGELRDPAPPRGGARPYVLSSAGILLGDVLSAAVFAIGVQMFARDVFSGGAGGLAVPGLLVMAAGAVSWTLLPPALGVSGARAGGAPRERAGGAYAAALALRLAGMFVVASAVERRQHGLALATFVATELVLAPAAIVGILGTGEPDAAPAPPLPSPAERALPAR